MKNCNVCGAPNADTAFQCSQCGSSLPVAHKPSKQSSINLKPILMGMVVLAVVGGILAGVLFLRDSTAQSVANAFEMNEEAIVQEVSKLANLSGYLENFEQLNDDGDFTASANVTSDLLDLSAVVDYSRDNRILSGTASYANTEQDVDVKFDFAANSKTCTLAADRLTSDIYGFSLSSFQKKFGDTHLASVLSVADFKKIDFSKTLEKKYGKVWMEFKKTLRYDELNERQMQIGNRQVLCKAYEVKWDDAAATKLVSTVLGIKGDFLPNMSGVLEKISPDCRIYVDEAGYVVAADFVVGTNKCTLTFEGEENIWEKCTLYSVSLDGNEGEIWGKLEIENGLVQCDLEWDGVMEFSLSYTDYTGTFEIEAELFDLPWYIDGQVISNIYGAQLSFGGYLPELGNVRFSLELTPLVNEPMLMSDKYVDLMNMDVSKWMRLFIDIGSNN